jgi:hypothetical protein
MHEMRMRLSRVSTVAHHDPTPPRLRAVRSEEAEHRLRELLARAGVDIDAPTAEDVDRTWEVVRTFAAEPCEDADPVDEDGDGILAQYGVYDWGQGEHFELDMTRQFSFSDDDGEYDHMAQLQCTFRFGPTGGWSGHQGRWLCELCSFRVRGGLGSRAVPRSLRR